LVAEHAARTRAGPIVAVDAFVEDTLDEIEIGAHRASILGRPARCNPGVAAPGGP
jgi:hypothetical protein